MDNDKLNIKKGEIVMDKSGFAIHISKEDWEKNYKSKMDYEEYRAAKLQKELELIKEHLQSKALKENK